MKLTINNSGKFYLHHHAVIKGKSSPTTSRVVFDASAKTTGGRSLDDIIYAGSKVQKDIFDILIKCRQWKYVLIADVARKYRQLKVADEF